MTRAWGGGLRTVASSVACACSQEVCEGLVVCTEDLERVLETGQRLAELLTSKGTSAQSPQPRCAQGAHRKAYP